MISYRDHRDRIVAPKTRSMAWSHAYSKQNDQPELRQEFLEKVARKVQLMSDRFDAGQDLQSGKKLDD